MAFLGSGGQAENLVPLGPHFCLDPLTQSTSFLSKPPLGPFPICPPQVTGFVTPGVGHVYIPPHIASLNPADNPAQHTKGQDRGNPQRIETDSWSTPNLLHQNL